MILHAISLVFSFLSAALWFYSSLIKLPNAPKKGDPVEVKPFEDMFEALNKISRLNKYAAISLSISILSQILKEYL